MPTAMKIYPGSTLFLGNTVSKIKTLRVYILEISCDWQWLLKYYHAFVKAKSIIFVDSLLSP